MNLNHMACKATHLFKKKIIKETLFSHTNETINYTSVPFSATLKNKELKVFQVLCLKSVPIFRTLKIFSPVRNPATHSNREKFAVCLFF